MPCPSPVAEPETEMRSLVLPAEREQTCPTMVPVSLEPTLTPVSPPLLLFPTENQTGNSIVSPHLEVQLERIGLPSPSLKSGTPACMRGPDASLLVSPVTLQ